MKSRVSGRGVSTVESFCSEVFLAANLTYIFNSELKHGNASTFS